MHAVTLDGKSIDEYLRKIKGYVDELAGVGVPVWHEEYVDVLLEGLLSDYAPVISIIESKKHAPSIAEIEALLYDHETRLTRYNRDAQLVSSASLNYTQGYAQPNTYKYSDFGGSQGSFGRSGGRDTFSDRNPGHGSGVSSRSCGGGRFANFQCQICLKYGHTANVCHFRTNIGFQPHESLTFFAPTTLQPIPYFTGSTRSSNTWVNPNTKSTFPGPSQPVPCSQTPPLMVMVHLAPLEYQILEPVFMLLVILKILNNLLILMDLSRFS